MTRPRNMSPVQERHYDRYCAASHDTCQAIKAAVAKAIAQAQIKMEAMLNDTVLFSQAYSTPNPAATGTNTTWLGHSNDLNGRTNNIWAMLNLGLKMRCDMATETANAMAVCTPDAPRRFP